MINQIIAWWVDNFSPREDRFEILPIIMIMGFNVVYILDFLFPGFVAPQYLFLKALLGCVTTVFGARVISQIYIAMKNAIAQNCNYLSTMLLNYYGLQANPPIINGGPVPDYMSEREKMLAFLFYYFGGFLGYFIIMVMLRPFLRAVGLTKDIAPPLDYIPAMLLGAVPGGIFGFTTGRLVEPVREIISERLEKRRSYQQARAIITLNDLPSNLKQNRYLPPEILGIIHRDLIGTSEQESTQIISEVIDESNNNICSVINNKISFFSSKYRPPQQLIEDIEEDLNQFFVANVSV